MKRLSIAILVVSIITITIYAGSYYKIETAYNNDQVHVTYTIPLSVKRISISAYSYYGAAAMTVVSELLVAILTGWMVYKTVKFIPSLRLAPKIILAGLIMGSSLYLWGGINLFAIIIISSALYFGALYFTKGISKELILEIVKMRKE